MKSFSDLNQSKKLAEILPLESADMCYLSDESLFPKINYNGMVFFNSEEEKPSTIIPCWSLVALLGVLPYEINDKEGTSRFFELYRGYREQYHIIYTGADEDIEGEYYDNFVDACVEMIFKLHEQKLL